MGKLMTEQKPQAERAHPEPPYLYLATIGWKSGKLHEIEIWFVEYDGRYYLCSGGRYRSHWVQNIQRRPAITFQIGAKTAPTQAGRGRVVPDLETDLVAAVRTHFDAKYQWSDGLLVELAPVQ